MLIHGRLILTASGLMLDEVRSLIQKGLRRKEEELVIRATKELLGRGKDQLPWKSLITFLFEDHCLNGVVVLDRMRQLHGKNDRHRAVELILRHCRTCRVAACLPVIAMDPEYDPSDWNPDLAIDPELVGLVSKEPSGIDFGLLLQHLKNAWIAKNNARIITYMKLASIVVDHEGGRRVTAKGQDYCLYKDKPLAKNVGAVVLSMLSKASAKTGDRDMARYAQLCCYFTRIQGAPVRLVMFAAAAQRIHSANTWTPKDLSLGTIDWNAVAELDVMPEWAVDKHTFRGKYGKGTTHILKKPDSRRLSTSALEEFHGPRPLKDIRDFFSEGVLCKGDQVMEFNPYWKRCQDLYLERPKRLQKTVHMTAVYYKELLKRLPSLKGSTKKVTESTCQTATCSEEAVGKSVPVTRCKQPAKESRKSTDEAPRDVSEDPSHVTDKKCLHTARKRSRQSENVSLSERPAVPYKVPKVTLETSDTSDQITDVAVGMSSPNQRSINLSTNVTNTASTNSDNKCDLEGEMTDLVTTLEPFVEGPLLQLPTGSGKVYTRLDPSRRQVWKGPYKPKRLVIAMFFHRALREVFHDPHTLNVKRNGHYLAFPLACDPDLQMEDLQITSRDFYDCISKKEVKDGRFVQREDLGIVQLHKLRLNRYANLPVSIWAHFLFRYVLNIGDSGLYNAITDERMTFVYGIDMEEFRGNKAHSGNTGNDLLNLMFAKLPRKDVCAELRRCLAHTAQDLCQCFHREFSWTKLNRLAEFYDVTFDLDETKRRLAKVKDVVGRLPKSKCSNTK